MSPQEHEDDTPTATINWQSQRPASKNSSVSGPGLVEITHTGDVGIRFPFSKAVQTIGSAPGQADLIIAGDPFVSGVHARVSKTNQGRWQIENCGSLNGLWLRVTEMPLERNAEFQISEQRFLVCPK